MRIPEPKRSLLAKVIGWLGTPDAALSALNLLDDEATSPIPYDTWKQMEDAFVERKPYGASRRLREARTKFAFDCLRCQGKTSSARKRQPFCSLKLMSGAWSTGGPRASREAWKWSANHLGRLSR
jgi:hypothetical protein